MLLDRGQSMPAIDPAQQMTQQPASPVQDVSSPALGPPPIAPNVNAPQALSAPDVTSAPAAASVPTLEDHLTQGRQKLTTDSAAPANKQGKLAQIGWLATQGIQKYFNPQQDIQLLGNAKKANRVAQDERYLAPLEQTMQNQQRQGLQNANIGIAQIKPEIMQADANTRALKQQADEEYKGNIIKLGVEKAKSIKEYRDQIVDLKTRGADQNDERIKALNRRIDETVRNNTATEAGRNSRATSGQTAATKRVQLAGQLKQGLAEYNAAEKSKNVEAMAAAREKLARLKAQHFEGQTPDEQ